MEKKRCRLYLLFTVFLLAGFYLAYRLYKIQVVTRDEWAAQAVNQRSDGLALYRQRGAILDCHGQPLTGRDHRPYLAVFPGLLTKEERKEITPLIAAHHVKMDEHSPVTIANPSAELLRFVTERSPAGVTFCTIPLRYGIKPLAHHLVGYVHPTNGQGLAGIEAVYEEFLRSNRMISLAMMTDAHQRPIPGLGWRYQEEGGAQPACNLVLTIDATLQKKVETVLDAAEVPKGAVVLLEVATGKIRALASRPVFDPYRPQLSLNDPNRSLLNRALLAYRPGSLLRLIIAAAALERGKLHPEQVFLDFESGYGLITLTQAFAYASLSVFQEVIATLDETTLWALAEACGWGKPCLNLPGEENGFLPIRTEGRAEAGWTGGEQQVTVTPVQIAGMLQVIANNGNYHPPSVVEGIWQPNGVWTQATAVVPAIGCPVLSAATVASLGKMLEATVLYGTGQKAQVRQGAAGIDGRVITGGRQDQLADHSWFAGYAPAHAPRLVGVVFLEDDPNGAEKAAMLFASLMESCLSP